MSRWGKPIKNKKRRDPRYFLNESMDLHENFTKKSYEGMLKAADSGRKAAQELVWKQAEDIVAKGLKFNVWNGWKIDKETIAKEYGLDPKTGKSLQKTNQKDAVSDMSSRLQKQRSDLQVSKDDGSPSKKQKQQKSSGASVKRGNVKKMDPKSGLKMMKMNIKNILLQKYKAKTLDRELVQKVWNFTNRAISKSTPESFEKTMDLLDKIVDWVDKRGETK
jgi:hypothetical protein